MLAFPRYKSGWKMGLLLRLRALHVVFIFIFSYHIASRVSVIAVIPANPPTGENPLSAKSALIRYWNRKIPFNRPKPSFLLSKASPLSAIDTAIFTKLAKQNALSTQLFAFCSAANLFCFPDLSPNLSKKPDANFVTYDNQNFTNYGTRRNSGVDSFKNYSFGLFATPIDSFRRYSRDSLNRNELFSSYGEQGNVADQNFTSYGSGSSGGSGQFTTYAKGDNIPNLRFTNYDSDTIQKTRAFTSYSDNTNVGNENFASYGKQGKSDSTDFENYSNDSNRIISTFNGYGKGGNGVNNTFKSYTGLNVPTHDFKNYNENGNGANETFTTYGNGANVPLENFKAYSNGGNDVTESFTSYGDAGNVPTVNFKNYNGDHGTHRSFTSYSTSGNDVHNSFSHYSDGSNGAFDTFTTYMNGSNVGSESFEFYAKNTNSSEVGFVDYGRTVNEKSSNFRSYGNESEDQKIDFKVYAINSTFKDYAKKGISFSEYNVSTPLSSREIVSKNRWVEPGKFFREKMLKQGTVIPMPDIRDKMPRRAFLPRLISAKIPFSTSKLETLRKTFDAREDSSMDNLMKKTLEECERTPSRGETKKCPTSIEDMLDFAVSVLGSDVVARTIENVNGYNNNIEIGAVKGINGGKITRSVSCHQSLFPYLVYYCHSVPKVRVYESDILDVKTKKKINTGIAICHLDTSDWSATHGAFIALGSKPGKIEVCHWIFENDMIWTVAD